MKSSATPNKKRKRSVTISKEQPVEITLDDSGEEGDENEPSNKRPSIAAQSARGSGPGPSSSSSPLSRGRAPPPPKNSGSSKSNDDHQFLAPTGILAPGKKKGTKKVEVEVDLTPKDTENPGDDPPPPILSPKPTKDQILYTNSCRKMRQAVIGSIYEVHRIIQVTKAIKNVDDLLENLEACWKRYPLVFSNEFGQLVENEDLSEEWEIRDFMRWWLHGLSSLVLYPQLGSISQKIVELISTFGQMVAYGNPNLVEIGFGEIITVISSLMSNSGRAEVELEYFECDEVDDDSAAGDVPGTSSATAPDLAPKKLAIRYILPTQLESDIASNESGIEDLLDILKVFIPHVFYFKHIKKDGLMSMLAELWNGFSDRRRFKIINDFLLPALPSLRAIPFPMELSTDELLKTVIHTGNGIVDTHSFFHYEKLCVSLSQGWKPCLNTLPKSLLLRLQAFLSNMISSDRFDQLPSDEHRSQLIQLYVGLTDENNGKDKANSLAKRDVNMFQVAAKMMLSFKTNHPILQAAVLKEVTDTFDRRVARDNITNWVFHPKKPGRKDIQKVLLEKECSPTWMTACSGFNFDILENIKIDDLEQATSALKRASFLITLASRVHSELLNYAIKANSGGWKLIFEPQTDILTKEMMTMWATFAGQFIAHLFSLENRRTDADDTLRLVLDTIQSFQSGKWYRRPLPLRVKSQLVAISGLPWLSQFKEFLPQKYLPVLSFTGLENIQTGTKARCLITLCSAMFIPWQDFVLRIVAFCLTNTNPAEDRHIVNCILDLIYQENWAIRSLPWSQIVLFLRRIQEQSDWESDPQFRNKFASSLLKLPCLYTNQEARSACMNSKKNNPKQRRSALMHLLRSPCPACSKEKEDEFPEKFTAKNFLKENESNSEYLVPLPEKYLVFILRLAVPLLRSRFQCAKTTLSELISCVRNHSSEFSAPLIAEFTTTAAHGNLAVGSEIMRHFSFFFRKPKPSSTAPWIPEEHLSLSQTGGDDRSNGIDLMFNTLLHFLQQSFQDQSSVAFSTKILIILRELAVSADRVLIVYVLRFTMRLLMHRDSDVRNVLSQSLCIELAAKSSSHLTHTAWELMTSLRYDLAKNVVDLILEEFCVFSEYSEQLQTDRVKAFLLSISTMGDFRTVAVFNHHYVPVLLGHIIPFIADDERYAFILKCLAEFASGPPEQLLQDAFHNYFRVLVLDYTVERANKVFAFLKQSYRFDPNFLAMNSAQSTMNEMLCFLSDRKEKVLKFIPCLPQKRSETFNFHVGPVSATRSEIQDILSRHLMGFFVFVDTKLHSRMECVKRKRRILQSFTILIELMGKSRITANRTKVYATLNSLFCLGPDFVDLLLESWKVFAANLENVAFTQLSVQILAAVSTLHQFLPSQVESLISYFIHTKRDLTAGLYSELYFVSELSKDPNVINPIKEAVDGNRTDSWTNFFETLVKESVNENSHIRLRAISKLQGLLSQDYDTVKNFVLDSEHPVVSQLLSSFLNAARDGDRTMLMRLAESFGSLGALDPYRFSNARDEEMRRKSKPILTVDGPSFAAKYLDILVREFQESDDTTDFDYCACLIQQLLGHFGVRKDEEDLVWRTLSISSRELVEPLLVSKYKVDKILPKLNMSSPIYLSDHGKNFDSWLSNWLSAMSAAVGKNTAPFELFQFSKYLVQRNHRVASFLLPYVATYAIIGGNSRQRLEIVTEVETILRKWIEQDTLKNSQIAAAVKESQADVGCPDPEPKILYDEDVIQYRCTQEVFSVLDHLYRAVRAAKRQAGLVRATTLQNQRRPAGAPEKSVVPNNPSLSEGDANTIAAILARIPMNTVSQVAFHCEDYKRALFYAEQDLKQNPNNLQGRLNYLQQLHVSLNDMDSVIGVAKIRQREGTMGEGVCESFAKGKIEVGVRSLELMVNEDPHDLIATSGLLQAYLSMDEPRKAETLIKGCVSRNPHWEVALEEFQIEATWKLRDWAQLRQQISSATLINPFSSSTSALTSATATGPTSTSNPLHLSLPSSTKEVSASWSMTIVQILSHVQSMEVELALEAVNEARLKLMNPLVAAAKDYNAYSRSYANVVQLHILTEVEQAIGLLEKSGRLDFELEKELKFLIGRWGDRGDFLQKAQTFVDPVLNVRKSILEILKKFSGGECEDLYNGSIRDCWLTAARVERKSGNFTRAFNCITEAKKYNSSQVMIELAKLNSRKGDKESALEVLQSSIPSYFPLVEEWKEPLVCAHPTVILKSGHLVVGGPHLATSLSHLSLEEQKARELCSAALLLQAQLSDQLQLLDIEKNITNYTDATNVFLSSEKNYFTLAGYHDRLLNGGEEGSAHSARKENVVKFYTKSLHHGCKYVYQSLPRLLTIWFDYSALGLDELPVRRCGRKSSSASSSKSGSGTSVSEAKVARPLAWEQTVNNMQTTIKTLLTEVPAYVLLTAFSQLISRLCHPNPVVWELLRELIGTIMCTHTHQALWMTQVVANSSVDENRTDRCKEIYRFVENKQPPLKKLINDYKQVVDNFLALCVKEVGQKENVCTVSKLCPKLQKFIQTSGSSDVLIPFQIFMNPSIPPNGCGHQSYDAFPQKFVFMRGLDEKIEIMQSVARPKRVTIRGSDGKRYSLLCKPKDDLRRDFKVMEVNNVVNWYLHRHPESRQRQLHVRSYAVIPLNEEHGLLEWVPNLAAFRGCVLSLYRERGKSVVMKDLKLIIGSRDSLETIRQKFTTRFLEPYPPVFSEWFLNNFNDPQSWYKARLSYIRTAAVMSIVGYILGLGDRHGENILFDCSNGEVLHVDFNCIFNQGETFQTPERVPFRLTQNMVEAMGPLGIEGVFRRSCEITMNLFRQHKDIFLSVLRPFLFDPLVEWKDASGGSKGYMPSDPRASHTLALNHFKNVTNRINGSARNMSKETNSELSIEAQVAYLIEEATHIDNLARMFIGWTPFI